MPPDTAAILELQRAHRDLAATSARAFYFSGDDHLRLTTFNSAAAVTLAVRGRFLHVDGRIEPFDERHVPNTDRTSASSLFARGEGWLLEAQIFATAGTPRRGQCFAILEVVRGLTGGIMPLSVLAQGYVTDTQRRGFPGSPLEYSTEGPGVLRSITGTDPAAGASVQETVPTNARWRLLALIVTLVTDATAANREAALTIDDGATVFVRAPAGVAHTASLTNRYNWTAHADRFTIAQDRTVTIPIPELWLPGGSRINTLTANIVAGDNYGAPQLLVEELIED